MPLKKSTRTILILDDDIGFAMWLGRVLNEAGLEALPASRSEEAAAIVDDDCFPNIDLVIANLAIAGSRDLVKMLASRKGSLKLIAIEKRARAAGLPSLSAVLHRPKDDALPSPQEYLKIVRKVLAEKLQ